MKLKVRMEGEQKDEALPHRPYCAENAWITVRTILNCCMKTLTALLLRKIAIARSEMFDIHGC